MEWWGYSKVHEWVLLDRSIPSNAPGKKGNLKFVVCSSGEILDIHFNNWREPEYLFEKRYLESLTSSTREIEENLLNTYKKNLENYKKLLFEPPAKSEIESPVNSVIEVSNKISKNKDNSSNPTSSNKTSGVNRLFGIGTDGAMFVWLFWGFLGMLVAPPLGVIIVLLLLGINILNGVDEYQEKKKRLQKTGELLDKHFKSNPQYTSGSRLSENKNRRSGTCSRCGGSGYLPQFNHIQNGVCFRCGGSGR